MIDCELLAKVYINLIDQKEPTLDFQNKDEIDYKKFKSQTSYFKKVIKPTVEEIKKHQDYINTSLKKNFFN